MTGFSPGTLRAVEGEYAAGAGLVEVIDLGLAELAAEAELMFADGVGDRIVEVAGDVLTTLGRRDADGIEAAGAAGEAAAGCGAADGDLGCAGEAGGGDAGVEAEGDGIVGVIGIGEDLVKVADAEEGLVGELGREDVVVDDRVVFYVDGGDLEVGAELAAGGGGLVAVAEVAADAELVGLVDVVVEVDDGVEAVPVFGAGVEVVDWMGAGR